MGRTANATVFTTTLLKREDCNRTKHDSDFSQWKILIGPCDWENYLLNKEGAERYRTHNLPNCSSCSGLYELGIALSLPKLGGKGRTSSKLRSKDIIPVYLGQADNVRTRLQQYGRDGAHLENGYSYGEANDPKVLGLFSDIFAIGFAIAYRWAPMKSKQDAERTESQLLKTFDYAWNRGMNGERRPSDIHQKLKHTTSSTKRLPLVLKKLHIFHSKEVGLRIIRCDSPTLDNGSSFYTKQNDTYILSRIFKFSRSRPILSKEIDVNNSDASICGVALGQGSICTRPPVEGRKRCVDHKGMKVNAFVRPRLFSGPDDTNHLTCGVTLDDASICTRTPVTGRKRCEEHKGRRINFVLQKKHDFLETVSGVDLEMGTFCTMQPVNSQKNCEEPKGMRVNSNKSKSKSHRDYTSNFPMTCKAVTLKGSICKRKPLENSKFCRQHEAMRANDNRSS